MSRAMDKGTMPATGGWMDQPSRLVEACLFVAAERRRHRAEAAEGLHPMAAMMLMMGGLADG